MYLYIGFSRSTNLPKRKRRQVWLCFTLFRIMLVVSNVLFVVIVHQYFNKRFSCWPIFSTISKVSNETGVYTWFSPSVVVLGAEKESKIIRPCQTKPFGSAWNDIHRGWTDDKAPPFRKSQCSKGMMFAMSLIILVCGKLYKYLIYFFYLQFCTCLNVDVPFVCRLVARQPDTFSIEELTSCQKLTDFSGFLEWKHPITSPNTLPTWGTAEYRNRILFDIAGGVLLKPSSLSLPHILPILSQW